MEMAQVKEVGVRRKVKNLSTESTKKRKVDSPPEFDFSCSSCFQLQEHSQLEFLPENQTSSENSAQASDKISSSSNQADGVDLQRSDVDQEEEEIESSTHSDPRTQSPVADSGGLETMERQSIRNSRRRSVKRMMPPQVEIDDFFAAVETNERKRFMDKYNYDIVKDVPLDGRYEWIRVKP